MAEPRPATDILASAAGRTAGARGDLSVDDVELLEGIAARDQRALESLHGRFAGGMYAVAFRVTRSERLAEEAVQDALMAVWQDPRRFDPNRGSLGPWLYTLARYKAIDAVRREAAIKRRTAEVDLELYEAPDDVHDEVWRSLRAERIGAAIAQLPEDQRRALSLAFIDELTHVEVAEREGIPLGTAKTRIRTALLRLRRELEPELAEGAGGAALRRAAAGDRGRPAAGHLPAQSGRAG